MFFTVLKLEFIKIKRSKIIGLVFIAPFLVIISGIMNLSYYLTPEYSNAWAAMFIQSALVYAYYLLPLSLIVICVMLFGIETKAKGMNKMLTLPIPRWMLSTAKLCVLIFYLFLEMLIFLLVFVLAGWIMIQWKRIQETLPILYLLKWCLYLFISMLPSLACIYFITLFFEKPSLAIGLNFLLVIPSVLIANTKLWLFYPYCYSGYLVSRSLHEFTQQTADSRFSYSAFLLYALAIFFILVLASVWAFGRKERK